MGIRWPLPIAVAPDVPQKLHIRKLSRPKERHWLEPIVRYADDLLWLLPRKLSRDHFEIREGDSCGPWYIVRFLNAHV